MACAGLKALRRRRRVQATHIGERQDAPKCLIASNPLQVLVHSGGGAEYQHTILKMWPAERMTIAGFAHKQQFWVRELLHLQAFGRDIFQAKRVSATFRIAFLA